MNTKLLYFAKLSLTLVFQMASVPQVVPSHPVPLCKSGLKLFPHCVNIGSLGGRTVGYGINDSGTIVGDLTDKRGSYSAFEYVGGKLSALTIPGKHDSSGARAINNKNVVTGLTFGDDDTSDAFVTEKDGTQLITSMTAGLFLPCSVNDESYVVGDAITTDGYRGFIWHSNTFLSSQTGNLKFVGTFGGSGSDARWINSSGDVAGGANTRTNELHAYLLHDGIMKDIGAIFGQLGSAATCVSDNGSVVGYSYGSDNIDVAFLYRKGILTTLAPPPNYGGSFASCINDRDEIAGYLITKHGGDIAAVWRDGVWYPLTGYKDCKLGWAKAINNNNQILCLGASKGSKYTCTFLVY